MLNWDKMNGRDCGWQGSRGKVKDRLKYMLENLAIPPDCKFFVGSPGKQEGIPAHKLILSAGSEVFYAMFFGPAVSSSSASKSSLKRMKRDMHIDIPDTSPEAFRVMLRYLYTDETIVTLENVMDVMQCADKYGIPDLQSSCMKFLVADNCDWKNFACEYLNRARLLQHQELELRAWKSIERNASTIFTSPDSDFTDISQDLLCEILARPILNADEIEVYKGAVRWSRANCEAGSSPDMWIESLGNAFTGIRFGAMTAEDLAKGPVADGLLTLKEQYEIMPARFRNLDPQSPNGGPLNFEIGVKNLSLSHVLASSQSVPYLKDSNWSFASAMKPLQQYKFSTKICTVPLLKYEETRKLSTPVRIGIIQLHVHDHVNPAVKFPFGSLHIEPLSEIVPNTSDLFIKLCKRKYPFVIAFHGVKHVTGSLNTPDQPFVLSEVLPLEEHGRLRDGYAMVSMTRSLMAADIPGYYDGAYMQLNISLDHSIDPGDANTVVFGRLLVGTEWLELYESWKKFHAIQLVRGVTTVSVNC